MDLATATHAALYLNGRAIRLAPVTDTRALSDMRIAVSLVIGCYSMRFLSGREVEQTEDAIIGLRSACAILNELRPRLLAIV